MKVRGKKNWREGERELNQGNLENFFSFQFYFGKIFDESTWRFWKTKEELEREKESELNQGNLENFFAFQFCFGKIFDESVRRFWKS